MTKYEELHGVAHELLKTVTDDIKFPARARELVREIAEYARGTEIYKENDGRVETFLREAVPDLRSLWRYLLERIVNAPTCIHRDSSLLLLMPLVDQLINETRMCRVCGCTEDNACAGGCKWVEDDLCSECAGESGHAY